MKSIVVSSKDRIAVIMDFFNQSDKELKLAVSRGSSSLTDDKGTVFKFMGYNGGDLYDRAGFRWAMMG